MANTDNPNGFKFIKSLTGHAELDTCVLNGEVSKGDALVVASGVVTIALADTPLIHGVAAEDGVSGDTILFYPALPWYVFEGQTESTFTWTTDAFTTCDIIGATGVQELDENASVTDVAQIIGYNPNSTDASANVRAWFVWLRSSYLPLLAAV